MNQIAFAKPKPKRKPRRKRIGAFLRFRPEFYRHIRETAARRGMSQVDFVETCVALSSKEAQPGLTFVFTLVDKPK